MNILRVIESFVLDFLSTGRHLPMQIDITNACNLKCAHCYHSHHRNDNSLSFEQWTKIIDDYFRLIKRLKYLPMIVICGGEPTISPHFSRILKYISDIDPNTHIVILTNGTRLNESVISAVKPFQNLSFQISLDGPDSERHDMIRGQGSFARSVQGIELLKKHKIRFNFLCVLAKRSSMWIEDFFKLSKELGPSSMNFTRLVENGFAIELKAKSVDRMLKPLELRSAFAEILKQSAAYGIRTKTEGPLYNLVYPGLGRNGRFWESLVIDYQGNLLASSRSRLKLGNVLDQKLEDLFLNNPLFKKLKNGEVEICGSCRFFNVCGGDRNAAFAAYGNFLGPDPGCWLINESQRGNNENNEKICINNTDAFAY